MNPTRMMLSEVNSSVRNALISLSFSVSSVNRSKEVPELLGDASLVSPPTISPPHGLAQ
jgi:hypothetical protein